MASAASLSLVAANAISAWERARRCPVVAKSAGDRSQAQRLQL